MVVLIAMLSGQQLVALIALFGANAAMILSGS
jgi:hypothetical protein